MAMAGKQKITLLLSSNGKSERANVVKNNENQSLIFHNTEVSF